MFCCQHELAGNSELLDLYFLLEVQAASANGTYVVNNPNLCISPPISWAGQANSLISYSFGQVGEFDVASVTLSIYV